MTTKTELQLLERIAIAIEQLKPPKEPTLEIKKADAYLWDAGRKTLVPVEDVRFVPLPLLKGIDEARDTLHANTLQFAKGYSANNALLWGARGMGKSSLAKAIWADVNKEIPHSLVLIEIHREDINTLPALLHALRNHTTRRFIIFCDDLSFDAGDSMYKSLKAVLEGGLEGRPDHVLFYATSNHRHLMQRDMRENERTAIHANESAEEHISLSDRLGLWIGFHPCSQDVFLDITESYAKHYKLNMKPEELHRQALEWAAARGARSGRVAWQFIQDLAGKMGKRV
jgi:predicted AAA+ superfamily ATPase